MKTKCKYFSFLCLSYLFLFSVSISPIFSNTINENLALCGTFTIGGDDPDYATFSDAVSVLHVLGVCGPVVFNVRAGNYQERIRIRNIEGISDNNTITFQSETGNNAGVVLHNYLTTSSSTNYIVSFDLAQWIHLKDMTISADSPHNGQVIYFKNSQHNIIENCVIKRDSSDSIYDYDAPIINFENGNNNHNTIHRNTIIEGTEGVGETGGLTSTPNAITVTNNTFINQSRISIEIRHSEAVWIKDNIIKNFRENPVFCGMSISSCTGNIQIERNQIHHANVLGLYFWQVHGTAELPVSIANNFVHVKGAYNNTRAIHISSSSFIHISHNTTNIVGALADSKALYLNYCTDIDVWNNILSNRSLGYTIYSSSSESLNQSNHNLLYTNGEHLIYQDNPITNLTDWQTNTGFDMMSLSAPPIFEVDSSYQAHQALLQGAGIFLDNVEDDIERNTRNNPPDIGAHEVDWPAFDAALTYLNVPLAPISPGLHPIEVSIRNLGTNVLQDITIHTAINDELVNIAHWTGTLEVGAVVNVILNDIQIQADVPHVVKTWVTIPDGMTDGNPANDIQTSSPLYTALNGNYTIGGDAPNFSSFTETAHALHTRGVSGPVIFNVRNGIYEERMKVHTFPGNEATNTIIFQSETQDSSQVIIKYGSVMNEAAIHFHEVDYVTWQQMTIETMTEGMESRGLFFQDCSNTVVANCAFELSPGSIESNFNYSSHLYFENTDNVADSSNQVKNSLFLAADNAIEMVGHASIISNNKCLNQWGPAIRVRYYNGGKILDNYISSDADYEYYRGITLNGSEIDVERNQIFYVNGIGMYISGYILTFSNNFIFGTEHAQRIIDCSFFNNLSFYHNTFHLQGTVWAAIQFSNGQHISFKNNSVSLEGTGLLLQADNNSFDSFDYNNLYSSDRFVQIYLDTYDNLVALQTGGLGNHHSVSYPPYLPTESPYRLQQISLNNAGTPLEIVPDDIEGQARNPQTPDIGVYEFTPRPIDAGLEVNRGYDAPLMKGTQAIKVLLKNHGTEDLQEVDINWIFDEVIQTTYHWTGALASGDTTTVEIGQAVFTDLNTHDVQAWTSLPNGMMDTQHANDTVYYENLLVGLAGVYTIGGSEPDFLNFGKAIDTLNRLGVAGHTIFSVRDGVYEERLLLDEVASASTDKTITFQSESGDSTSVVITYETSSSEPEVCLLNDAKWMRLHQLSIQPISNSLYNTGIKITYLAQENRISNCHLSTETSISGESENNSLIFIQNSDKQEFINNHFSGNHVGLFYTDDNEIYSDNNRGNNLKIIGNYFTGHLYQSINISTLDSLILSDNIIDNSEFGVYLNRIEKQIVIIRNQLTTNRTALQLTYCSGEEDTPLLFANNFIRVKENNSNYSSYGINIVGGVFKKIYHNTIKVEQSSGMACLFNSGTHNHVFNNIFYSSGNIALSIFEFDETSAFDYNNIYSTGEHLIAVGYNEIFSDLAAYQVSTGLGEHSLSLDPFFTTEDSYNISNPSLNGTAFPLPIISTDIEGKPRDTHQPDIGAVEFFAPPHDAGVLAIHTPEVPFGAAIYPVEILIKNYGTNPLESLEVHWSANQIAQEVISWSGELAAGDSTTILLDMVDFGTALKHEFFVQLQQPNGMQDSFTPNDTLSKKDIYVSLLGDYTIGGSQTDFTNFASAVEALTKGGILGAVVFYVRNGVYDEQISIEYIDNTNAENTITFQSESGDNTAVVLSANPSPETPYVLLLNNVQWLRFKNITILNRQTEYVHVVMLRDSASHHIFEGNIFQSPEGSIGNLIYDYSSLNFDRPNSYNSIINNHFINGNIGFYSYQYSIPHQHEGDLAEELHLKNNIFRNQLESGISVYRQHNSVIDNNHIIMHPEAATGIRTSQWQGNYRITNNHLDVQGLSSTGISIYSLGQDNGGLIANNFIDIYREWGTGIFVQGTKNTHVLYNTIVKRAYDNLTNELVQIRQTDDTKFYNNNLFTRGEGGVSLKLFINNNFESNHNNIFSNGGLIIEYNFDTYFTTLADWSNFSNQDLASISVNPLMQEGEAAAYHLALNGAALPFENIVTDLIGQSRDAEQPDIGAIEFEVREHDIGVNGIYSDTGLSLGVQPAVYTTFYNYGSQTVQSATLAWSVNGVEQNEYLWSGHLASTALSDTIYLGDYDFQIGQTYEIKVWTKFPNGQMDGVPVNDTICIENIVSKMGGIYTIGGNNPDYETFTDAVNDMNNYGLGAAVTFNVRTGIYVEQINLTAEITGWSSENTITFQSEALDPEQVLLTYTSENITGNYVVKLDRIEHVKFKYLTIEAGGQLRGRAILILDYVRYLDVINNKIIGHATSGSVGELVYSGTSSSSVHRFLHNHFEGGTAGIYCNTSSGSIEVSHNTFSNQTRYGLYSYHSSSATVNSNLFTTSGHHSYYACYLRNIEYIGTIQNNIVNLPSILSGGGMDVYMGGNASNLGRSLFANNFIYIGEATNGVFGLKISGKDLDVVHNTIYQNSNSGAVIRLNSRLEGNLLNNNFVNLGSGQVLTASQEIDSSDYNNFYSNGGTLVYYNSQFVDNLSAWQAITNHDGNSLSIDPLFLEPAAPYISATALDGAGIPVPEVTYDIDGNPRNINYPDIGAVEFSQRDLSITAINGLDNRCNLSQEEALTITLQNEGLQTITDFEIAYQVNQQPWVIEQVSSQTLMANDIMEYTFASPIDASVIQTYHITALVNLLDDSQLDNDTLYLTVEHLSSDTTYLTSITCDENEVMTTETLLTNQMGCDSLVILMITLDNEVPVARCRNITRYLSNGENIDLTTIDVDDGSSDNCSIVNSSLSSTNFSCADIGDNAVVLTITDNIGQINTCTSVVTIIDDVAPEVQCLEQLTIELEEYNVVQLQSERLDEYSFDNCTNIEDLKFSFLPDNQQSNMSFLCESIGEHIIDLWVTDQAGNQSVCTVQVLVNPGLRDCDCDEENLELNDMIVPADVYRSTSITSNGQIIEGKRAFFGATETITLNPNFEVPNGSEFWAMIENCDAQAIGFDDETDVDFRNETKPVIAVDIYPNPASDVIYVHSTQQTNAHVILELYDILGQKIHHQHTFGGESGFKTKINMHNLTGVFWLIIIDGQKRTAYKVMKF